MDGEEEVQKDLSDLSSDSDDDDFQASWVDEVDPEDYACGNTGHAVTEGDEDSAEELEDVVSSPAANLPRMAKWLVNSIDAVLDNNNYDPLELPETVNFHTWEDKLDPKKTKLQR